MDKIKSRLNKTGYGSNHSFKPEIGNADAVLIHSRPQRLGETPLERTERLSKIEADAINHKKQIIHKMYYDQFDYKPRIDAVSEALVRHKPVKTVDELVYDEQHSQLMEKLKTDKEKVFLCTLIIKTIIRDDFVFHFYIY